VAPGQFVTKTRRAGLVLLFLSDLFLSLVSIISLDENSLRAKLPLPLILITMELTKEYFDQQLKNLATKDDLLELATKTDLSAVRSDIADVKEAVERLGKTEDEDIRGAFRDIALLKKRVSVLERSSTHR